MVGYIYKITNLVNGKKYIGLTKDFKRRMQSHTSNANTGIEKTLYRAMRKYGLENFEFKKIIKVKENDSDSLYRRLYELEKIAIKRFDTYKNGYNNTLGGDGVTGYVFTEEVKRKISLAGIGKRHTEESKLKMSLAKKGYRHSKEARLKISESAKKRDRVNFKGKSHTEEAKKRMSEFRQKEVFMYGVDGSFIENYKNTVECCEKNNFPLSKHNKTNTSITKIAKSEIGSYKGYQFRYYKKDKIEEHKTKIVESNGKPIYDDYGNRFETITQCSNFYNVAHSTIVKYKKNNIYPAKQLKYIFLNKIVGKEVTLRGFRIFIKKTNQKEKEFVLTPTNNYSGNDRKYKVERINDNI